MLSDGTNAYIYGPALFPGDTAPIEQLALTGGATSYLNPDQMGVREVFSPTGTLQVQYTYQASGLDAYGSNYTTNTLVAGVTTPFQYKDGYLPGNNGGLIYAINRWYDPKTGQWLTQDPIVELTGQAYSYAADNPINASDPTGLAGCEPGPESAINTGDVTVYTSANAAGEADYVGITNSVERRAAEQLAEKGIGINPINGLENLSRADARAVEQVLIEENGGPGGGQLLAKINSIASNNPIYSQSIQRGCALLAAFGYAAPNVCGG
jgi:RHS repeat-associated protein